MAEYTNTGPGLEFLPPKGAHPIALGADEQGKAVKAE
jgi:hypothetical protein